MTAEQTASHLSKIRGWWRERGDVLIADMQRWPLTEEQVRTLRDAAVLLLQQADDQITELISQVRRLRALTAEHRALVADYTLDTPPSNRGSVRIVKALADWLNREPKLRSRAVLAGVLKILKDEKMIIEKENDK